MHFRYRVELTAAERGYLEAFTSQGKQRVRALKQVQILLLADGRGMTTRAITAALSVSTSKVDEATKQLVDEYYPDATRIRVVLDNYSMHQPASLSRAFPAPEARRLLRKLEFHCTPKHASWLNMVEIDVGNMNRQCLDCRIPSMDLLKSELAAWEQQRNREKASIGWMFYVDKAKSKLHRAYDSLTGQN